MSRHAAKASFETRIVEGAFNALFGTNTPDRDGRHRAVDTVASVHEALKKAAREIAARRWAA